MYVLDVAPLLAIMSLPQAVSDAFYVLWSSPMGRLSRGEGLDAAAEAGATAVIQPGGSIRDEEVIAAANEAGMAMVFTGERHFKH